MIFHIRYYPATNRWRSDEVDFAPTSQVEKHINPLNETFYDFYTNSSKDLVALKRGREAIMAQIWHDQQEAKQTG